MDFQSICLIIAWGLIIIFGIAAIFMIGWSGDEDAPTSARFLRFFIGFIFAIPAWVIWRNLSSANLVVGWVLCIVLGILGPILMVVGIGNLSSGTRHAGKQYLLVGGGIISIGLAILVASLWLGINDIIGWLLFIILGILGLVMIGWGIYDITDFEQGSGILKIAGGCVSVILALVISYYWLHSTTILNIIGWVFFVIFGILGILATIWGILTLIFGSSADDKKIGLYILLGGTVGIGLAFTIGSFGLHLAWLRKVDFWNPFFILPIVTIFTGIVLGFVINLYEGAVYKGGYAIDRSAEWRIVGSNAKYSDATVRDVYDHSHGRGSWGKITKNTITFWRIVCVLLSAYWFIGSLLFTDMKDTYPVLITILNDFNSYSLPLIIALLVILLLISGFIGFVFGMYSKHR